MGRLPEDIRSTLRRAAGALREAEVPFMLAGSMACWARGGPASQHDLDLIVAPHRAEAALEALVGAGMRPERPAEEWLLKAWDGDVLVDLIFAPRGLEVTDELIEAAECMSVSSVLMRVMSLEGVLITKLRSLSEQHLEYSGLLEIARATREQVDWGYVRERTVGSPFAMAYFALLEGLEIIPAHEDTVDRPASRPSVRVVGSPAPRSAAS